jgi:hypothetical protein
MERFPTPIQPRRHQVTATPSQEDNPGHLPLVTIPERTLMSGLGSLGIRPEYLTAKAAGGGFGVEGRAGQAGGEVGEGEVVEEDRMVDVAREGGALLELRRPVSLLPSA